MEKPLRSLKGVGEKTEKLFQKIGVSTTEELLRYYPRNYEAYEAPVPVEELKEGCIASVQATIVSGVYINKVRNLQVITITAADATEKIGIAWFNMSYLKNMLKKGSVFIQRSCCEKAGKTSDGTPGNLYACSIWGNPSQPAAGVCAHSRPFQ